MTVKETATIERTLSVLGDRWTGLILHGISKDDLSFCQIESECVGISPRTLSQRLDKLEQEKIVTKKLYCQHPPRYKYTLTKKGKELDTVLNKMAAWGARYAK